VTNDQRANEGDQNKMIGMEGKPWRERPRVAAVVTEYRPLSHADVLVTKLLQGYDLFWTPIEPRVEVVSLYLDQVPANDIGREIAARHGVPIYPTIREALTLGGDELAVDGVILVGEHGDYALNEKGQKLYPRRRFFEETVNVFRDSGRVVPVFTDKHLSYNWPDSKWIYDTAVEMDIPLMAGSSMPIAFRCPPGTVPLDSEVEEIVAVAHGPLESYGYHVLEIAQSLAERRRGYETGVAAVTCLYDDAFWAAWDAQDRWSRALQTAAIGAIAHQEGEARAFYDGRRAAGTVRQTVRPPKGTPPAAPYTGAERAFLVEYRDGLQVTVLMLAGYALDWGAAVRVKGSAEPLAFSFIQDRTSAHSNFSHLSYMVEEHVRNGKPPYPVERTLLASGLIDAAMTSHYEDGRRVETPHLEIKYSPADAEVVVRLE
jgi:hypothetical protein